MEDPVEYLDPELFVVALQPDDVCQICQLALEDVPNLVCGHSFHRACLVEWVCTKQNRSCPSGLENCAPLPDPRTLPIIHALNSRLARSEIRCPYGECGRKFVVGAGHVGLKTHMERECEYHRVPCQHCKLPQTFATKHCHELDECHKRPMFCHACGCTETADTMQVSHPGGVCPDLVECPNGCTKPHGDETGEGSPKANKRARKTCMVPLRQLDQHVAVECPLRQVTCSVCKQTYRCDRHQEHVNDDIQHLRSERDAQSVCLEQISKVTGKQARLEDLPAVVAQLHQLSKQADPYVAQQKMLRYLELCPGAGDKQLPLRPISPSTWAALIRLPITGVIQNGLLGPLRKAAGCRKQTAPFQHDDRSFHLQCVRSPGGTRVSVYLTTTSLSSVTLSYSIWLLRKGTAAPIDKVSHIHIGHLQSDFNIVRNTWGVADAFGFFDVWGRMAYNVTHDEIELGIAFHPTPVAKSKMYVPPPK